MALEDLEASRRASVGRVLDVWASLAARYGNVGLDADDEIDICTGEVVRDRGVLKRLREARPVGGRIEESEASSEDDDIENDSDDELGRWDDDHAGPSTVVVRALSLPLDLARDQQELQQFLHDEEQRRRGHMQRLDDATSESGSTSATVEIEPTPELERSVSRAPSIPPPGFNPTDDEEEYDSHDELALVDEPPETPFTSPVKPSQSVMTSMPYLTPPRSQSVDSSRITSSPFQSAGKQSTSLSGVPVTPSRRRLRMEVVLPSLTHSPASSYSSTPGRKQPKITDKPQSRQSTPFRTPTLKAASRSSTQVLPSPSPSVEPTGRQLEFTDSKGKHKKTKSPSQMPSEASSLGSSHHRRHHESPELMASSSHTRASSTSQPRPVMPAGKVLQATTAGTQHRDLMGKGKATAVDLIVISDDEPLSEGETDDDGLRLASPISQRQSCSVPPHPSSQNSHSPPQVQHDSNPLPRANSASPRKRRRSSNSSDESSQHLTLQGSPTKRRTLAPGETSHSQYSQPQQSANPPRPPWPSSELPIVPSRLFATAPQSQSSAPTVPYNDPTTVSANIVAHVMQQLSAVLPGLLAQQHATSQHSPTAMPYYGLQPGVLAAAMTGFGYAGNDPSQPGTSASSSAHDHQDHASRPHSHSRPATPSHTTRSRSQSRSALRTPSSVRVRKHVSFLLTRERSSSAEGERTPSRHRPGDEEADGGHSRGREKMRVKGTPAPGQGRRGWSEER
ncbi:hypothetical protein BKA62DRAFT_769680 [Auriculariales sp. MPI-PUGE-AT-0066]|nr:hypothetical protein BKA62DRAFT_769680 [Auriculariales sp. MPI-PUGE-AT-0066]